MRPRRRRRGDAVPRRRRRADHVKFKFIFHAESLTSQLRKLFLLISRVSGFSSRPPPRCFQTFLRPRPSWTPARACVGITCPASARWRGGSTPPTHRWRRVDGVLVACLSLRRRRDGTSTSTPSRRRRRRNDDEAVRHRDDAVDATSSPQLHLLDGVEAHEGSTDTGARISFAMRRSASCLRVSSCLAFLSSASWVAALSRSWPARERDA